MIQSFPGPKQVGIVAKVRVTLKTITLTFSHVFCTRAMFFLTSITAVSLNFTTCLIIVDGLQTEQLPGNSRKTPALGHLVYILMFITHRINIHEIIPDGFIVVHWPSGVHVCGKIGYVTTSLPFIIQRISSSRCCW
uniref:Uncharacterized protein n=1 Tax=Cacopsylla melanoneura TaxID=428564 RepID=A0A8D8ZTD4_9HEMI